MTIEEINKIMETEEFIKEYGEFCDELSCGGSCCKSAGKPPIPNPESSEWVCDCACHFNLVQSIRQGEGGIA